MCPCWFCTWDVVFSFAFYLFIEILAGCGMLRTRWRPTRGLASLRSAQKISKLTPPRKSLLFAQKVPQEVPQKDPAPSWAIRGKFGFFEFFQNYTPPGGGQPKKIFRGYPQGPGGGPCQVWLRSIQYFGRQIRTNKQTNRQTPLFYIYRYHY